MEPFYPLHALVCSGCRLVQLAEFESPKAIFSRLPLLLLLLGSLAEPRGGATPRR